MLPPRDNATAIGAPQLSIIGWRVWQRFTEDRWRPRTEMTTDHDSALAEYNRLRQKHPGAQFRLVRDERLHFRVVEVDSWAAAELPSPYPTLGTKGAAVVTRTPTRITIPDIDIEEWKPARRHTARLDSVSLRNPYAESYEPAAAKQLYSDWINGLLREEGNANDFRREEILSLLLPKLRGYDLACHCPQEALCHGDILLGRANMSHPDYTSWATRVRTRVDRSRLDKGLPRLSDHRPLPPWLQREAT